MSNGKKELSRRLLLQGLGGLGIVLPMLEFTHGKAWAAAPVAGTAKRFIVFFEHGGTITNINWDGNAFDTGDTNNNKEAWTPHTTHGLPLAGKLNDIHQPCVGLEDYMLVVDGVDNLAAKVQSDYNGGHGWTNVTVLTNGAADYLPGDNVGAVHGTSIDNVIASRLMASNPVPFKSINLTVPAHNYGTPFYSGPQQPVEGEENPVAAFSKLFANVKPGSGPDPSIVRALALRKSVLDGTSAGLSLYKKRVSAQDSIAIDAHLSHIRGIEQQLASFPVPSAGCTVPTIGGTGSYPDIPQIGPAQVDILIAAFRCGLTNVGTLNIGDFYNTWMNDPYPAAYNIGHSLDHSANDVGPKGNDVAHFSDWYKTILDNRQWRASMFARLLDGLKSSPEGAGNMLDNSLILWTSEFRYGGVHGCSNLPLALAGKAGGQLKTNRYLNYSTKSSDGYYQTSATLSNLHASCLNMFGFPDTTYGVTTFPDRKASYPAPPAHVVTRYVPGPLSGLGG